MSFVAPSALPGPPPSARGSDVPGGAGAPQPGARNCGPAAVQARKRLCPTHPRGPATPPVPPRPSTSPHAPPGHARRPPAVDPDLSRARMEIRESRRIHPLRPIESSGPGSPPGPGAASRPDRTDGWRTLPSSPTLPVRIAPVPSLNPSIPRSRRGSGSRSGGPIADGIDAQDERRSALFRDTPTPLLRAHPGDGDGARNHPA